MTTRRPTCSVHSCMVPVEAYGQYCRWHLLGFSAAQRAAVEQPTEALDSLELLYRLPSHGEEAA